MGQRWRTERVAALAPDSASAVAGRRLARPGPWSDVGWTDPLIWGSCQGSGKTPYAVAVDTAVPTYRCTCPSRKFPCKHVLGLLYLWAEGQIDEGGTLSPQAAEWAAKRTSTRDDVDQRSEPAEKSEAQLAASAARAAMRDERVLTGLRELDRWLTDQVTLGLAHTRADQLEAMAARLIDAQAPGPAGRLRDLARLPRGSASWLESMLEEYALLHLLCVAATRDDLPDELRHTIRTRLGFTTSRESVLAIPPTSDTWAVVGMRDSDEELVSVRRVWLYGMTTHLPALVLFFTPYGSAVDSSLVPGTAVDADLHFYPGRPGLRALVGARRREFSEALWHAPGPPVKQAITSWQAALAADPWLTEWPVAAGGQPKVEPWGAFADPDGVAVPLLGHDVWTLLALTGGEPTTVFGEMTSRGLRPTSVVLDSVVTPL